MRRQGRQLNRALYLLLFAAGPARPATLLDSLESAIRSGEFKKITSIAVSRNGKLLYERYFEGDASTLRNTRSATKSVTGALIGIAIAKGYLAGPAMPVAPFFADHQPFLNPDPRKSAITVEDLLTMNSALDCNDWVDNSPGNEEKMYPTKDWVRFTFDLPLRAARGFSYCTAGVAMLGEVLQRAAKMPVPDFAREYLFEPLGIRHAKWSYSPTGVAMTGGGLEVATLDLMKIAQLYANRGDWNGKPVIPANWVETSTKPHARIDDHTEYGYLWWITTFKSQGREFPSYYMTGNGGNKVVVIPASGLIAVITSTNYNTRGMHQQTERILTDFLLPHFAR